MGSRQTKRRWGGAICGALVLMGGGCFVGNGAKGLRCENDVDCGINMECTLDAVARLKCCGGTCNNEQASDSTTSASTSSTSGTASSSSSSEASSGGAVCGNGVVEPGEQCEEGDDDCRDCQFQCGDGEIDGANGELCDNAALPDGEGCTDTCRTWIALAWDESDDVSATNRDFPGDLASCSGQPWCLEWTDVATGPRRSGPYYTGGEGINADDPWPQALLVTRPITFPTLSASDTVSVTVNHVFEFNASGMSVLDHAIIALAEPGDLGNPANWTRVLPTNQGVPILCELASDECFAGGEPPVLDFCDTLEEQAYAGTQQLQLHDVNLSADLVSERTLHMVFRLRYDCDNFMAGPTLDDAWEIHAVTVTVVRG